MMLTGENGILTRTIEAKDKTIIAQEKEQVEMAYITAAIKNLSGEVSEKNLQDELDLLLGDAEITNIADKKTEVTTNKNGTYNVHYNETSHDYNVNGGQVEKIERIEDGIYIGNVRMGELYIADWTNGNYVEDYRAYGESEMNEISEFLYECQNEPATSSEYKQAIKSAEKVGISTEWIDYAYNNQGVIVRNLGVPKYSGELTYPIVYDRHEKSAAVNIDCYGELRNEDENFRMDVNLSLYFDITLWRGDSINFISECVELNPEPISFYLLDASRDLADSVELPFGMVLKQNESDEFIIEWQGRTFTEDELREFVNKNIKIVYNGETISISASTTGKELTNFLGIDTSAFEKMCDDLYEEWQTWN